MEFIDKKYTADEIQKLLLKELPYNTIKGTNADDKFTDIQSLWDYFYRPRESTNALPEEMTNEPEFYSQAFEYWESPQNCPVTDNGVLGGYGHLTPCDARDSLMFLENLKKVRPGLQFNIVAGMMMSLYVVSSIVCSNPSRCFA